MANKDVSINNGNFLDKIRSGKAVAKSDGKVSTETLQRAVSREKAKGKLLFSLDATASRSGAWEVSKQITNIIFDTIPGQLEVALAYHGGSQVKKFTDFTKSFKRFQDQLMMIECEAGMTQLNEILLSSSKINGLGAICYIGDCYEENLESAKKIALSLKLNGTKLFIFQDKTEFEEEKATLAFNTLVDICGGAVLDFNQNAVKEIEELLTAVTLFSAGGKRLLQEQKKLPGASKLLEKLK